MSGLTSSTQLADGGHISWTHWPGTGAHSAVFIHGIGNQSGSWFGIPEMLASKEWQITAIDLRGHGKSLRRGPYSIEQFAADVADVLRCQGIPTPILIGHSLGALVCTALAQRPEIGTRAVINVDQALRLSDFAAVVRSLWPYLTADFTQTVVPVFESMMPASLPASLRQSLKQEYATMDAAPAMSVWAPLVELDSDQIAALVEQMLGGITVPYLALHGSDPGPDYGTWLRERLPMAEVEVWDGAQHFPHLLYPERFVSRVVEFAAAA